MTHHATPSLLVIPCPNGARRRAGLSLLEVLFAIFIAAVGLLGLAALLTVGGVQTSQSERADRSAAAGRAGLREVEARGMLRPFVGSFRANDPSTAPVYTNLPNWLNAAGAWPPAVNPSYVNATHYQRLPAFVIDPLFVTENGAAGAAQFPFYIDPSAASLSVQLPRVTLAGLVTREAADRVFTCRDDAIFFEHERNGRPNAGPDNNRNGVLDTIEYPDAPIIQGDYSYLVMVTPSELENPVPTDPSQWTPPATLNPADPPYQPLNKAVALDQRRMFTVQVVVFHKRVPSVSTEPPSERQMFASVSGQSVTLSPSRPELVRGLGPNQWIMLSGHLKPPNDDSALNNNRPIHRWVRIVSVGKTQGSSTVRVNFSGPDWPTGSIQGGNTVATVVDNVVGVYERNVELDARSFTAP